MKDTIKKMVDELIKVQGVELTLKKTIQGYKDTLKRRKSLLSDNRPLYNTDEHLKMLLDVMDYLEGQLK
jgi:hypothetical protein